MENIWDILKIPPTDDVKAIKKAYATRLRDTHPEEDAVGFVRLHEAYRTALGMTAQKEQIQNNFESKESIPLLIEGSCGPEDVLTPIDIEFKKWQDEIEKLRIIAIAQVIEFLNVNYYYGDAWKEFLESDIFQQVKFDREFLQQTANAFKLKHRTNGEMVKLLWDVYEFDVARDSLENDELSDLYYVLRARCYRYQKMLDVKRQQKWEKRESNIVWIILIAFVVSFLCFEDSVMALISILKSFFLGHP